jgi:hypothetical protein
MERLGRFFDGINRTYRIEEIRRQKKRAWIDLQPSSSYLGVIEYRPGRAVLPP